MSNSTVDRTTETIYRYCLQGYAMAFMPALKTEWVDALRSGKFIQGKHYLRTADNNFCCMGVALNLIDPNGWQAPHGPDAATDWRNCEAVLTAEPLRNVLGLPDKTVRKLANMNDGEGSSFAQIADWIEKNL